MTISLIDNPAGVAVGNGTDIVAYASFTPSTGIGNRILVLATHFESGSNITDVKWGAATYSGGQWRRSVFGTSASFSEKTQIFWLPEAEFHPGSSVTITAGGSLRAKLWCIDDAEQSSYYDAGYVVANAASISAPHVVPSGGISFANYCKNYTAPPPSTEAGALAAGWTTDVAGAPSGTNYQFGAGHIQTAGSQDPAPSWPTAKDAVCGYIVFEPLVGATLVPKVSYYRMLRNSDA